MALIFRPHKTSAREHLVVLPAGTALTVAMLSLASPGGLAAVGLTAAAYVGTAVLLASIESLWTWRRHRSRLRRRHVVPFLTPITHPRVKGSQR